jgi:hypothetical protein
MTENEVVIRLTRDEFDVLLIMMGYAAAAAYQQKNTSMAYAFIRIANAVNKDNLNWTPYEVPEK